LILVLVLLGLSGFFSSAETALFSLKLHQLQRLRTRHTHAGAAVLALLEHPRRLLATILVGNTTVNLVLSILAAGLFVNWFGPERGSIVATLVITIVLLVFGEIAPKTLAVGRPLWLATRVAPPLTFVQRLLTPATSGAVRLSDALSEAMERRVQPRDEALTEEEIKTLVTMGWEQGVVGAREKEFIHNVFHLDDRQVQDIVTPRSRVFAIDQDDEVASVRGAVREAGFSRVPVYASTPENLVGYVEVTDLLWGKSEPDTRRVRDLRRDLHFYPETKRVGQLLSDMREAGQEIAGVVDEHGDFAGIVSLEDAVEQVVGEIFDQHDLDRFRFTSLTEGEVLVTAQMEIAVFNELLDAHLEDPEAETIGGYVVNRMRKIPREGESFEAQGLRFTVEQAAPNRVVKLRVQRRLPGEGRRA
jgi:putative hemolysin